MMDEEMGKNEEEVGEEFKEMGKRRIIVEGKNKKRKKQRSV